MFTRRSDYMPLDSRWFDITVWGGVLVVTAYAMGTLYEHNQKGLRELKNGYDGMLVILQQFLGNQKNSEAEFVPGIDLCDARSLRRWDWIRRALKISDRGPAAKRERNWHQQRDLYKAANLSQEELERGMRKGKARAPLRRSSWVDRCVARFLFWWLPSSCGRPAPVRHSH